MATIDSTLNEFMKLDFNTREVLLEVMQKRQVEARRLEVAKSAKKSLKEYHSGKYEPLTAADAVKKLEAL